MTCRVPTSDSEGLLILWIHSERQVTMGVVRAATVLSTDRVVSLENTECRNHHLSSPYKHSKGPCMWLQTDAAPCSVDTLPCHQGSSLQAAQTLCLLPHLPAVLDNRGGMRRFRKWLLWQELCQVSTGPLSVKMLCTHTVTAAECFAFCLDPTGRGIWT